MYAFTVTLMTYNHLITYTSLIKGPVRVTTLVRLCVL